MFDWRVSCRAQSGALTSEYACFDEGDAPLDDLQTENFLTGVTAWESFGAFLPAGGAVTWRYCREFLAAYADAEDAGFLRGVVWTPAATPSGIDGWSNVPLVTNEFPAAKFATADVDGWVVTENADVICATNVADGCSKWVSLTVEGPGVLSFDWRVSCEGGYELTNGVYCAGDFLGLFVDDATNAVARIDGVRPEAYVPVAYTNTASGVRTYRWRYVKDGSDAAGEDAGWLKNVRWTPLATPPATTVVYRDAAGVEREVRVPHAWVDEMGLLPAGSSDYEAALWQPSGKKSADGTALFRWQDYLAGTDPSDLADTLRITRFDVSAGAVSLSWAPDLRSATPPRTYRLWGRERLETGAWTTPTNSTHRFFRLEVLIDE
jgi:hypothetical protein